jgi:hypothetical protein
MEHALPESIKEEVIERSALPHSGYSGSELEGVRLRDGSRLVPQAHHSRGRLGAEGHARSLWTTGVLNRVSVVIEYPVVSVELGTDSWTIVMRH